jgi:hypothetical protein
MCWTPERQKVDPPAGDAAQARGTHETVFEELDLENRVPGSARKRGLRWHVAVRQRQGTARLPEFEQARDFADTLPVHHPQLFGFSPVNFIDVIEIVGRHDVSLTIPSGSDKSKRIIDQQIAGKQARRPKRRRRATA